MILRIRNYHNLEKAKPKIIEATLIYSQLLFIISMMRKLLPCMFKVHTQKIYKCIKFRDKLGDKIKRKPP